MDILLQRVSLLQMSPSFEIGTQVSCRFSWNPQPAAYTVRIAFEFTSFAIQGMSKSFGFAQFATLSDAQAFLEPSYPFVTLPPPSYVPPGGLDPEDDRTRRVKIDYSQSAQPHNADPSRPPRHAGPRYDANDGTRDIGSAHVPVLLLRGLDSTSTPDMIGEALRMSEGPGKKSAKGMKRIILIRDRASKISLGLAFVEFVDIKVSCTIHKTHRGFSERLSHFLSFQTASAVLANTMSPLLFPNGFRISGIPVAASFAQVHSFQLTPDGTYRDDSCVDASSSIGGRDSGHARYWDESTVVSEMVYEIEEEKPVKKSSGKDKEKRKERSKVGSSAKSSKGDYPSHHTLRYLLSNSCMFRAPRGHDWCSRSNCSQSICRTCRNELQVDKAGRWFENQGCYRHLWSVPGSVSITVNY